MQRYVLCVLFLLGVITSASNADPVPTSVSLRAAIRDLVSTYGDAYPHGQEYLSTLDFLDARIADAKTKSESETLRRLNSDLLQLQRNALLSNPLISAQPILYVLRRQYRPDHHNTETMFQTGEINTASFEGGSALKTVDFKNGGKVVTLIDSQEGSIRDPEVHFDANRIVLSMRKNIADDYHLYEVNRDGSGLRQLTRAKGIFDIDPIYLPDDSIVFSSSREPKYCMCNRHIMANLFKMEPDGANIHQIGKSTLFEGHGSLMPDGRIIYSRWEYVDRNFGDAQALWTVYPDGTNHAVYWGNNTQSPGGVLNARVIPGTEKVLCVFGSCHDLPWGALAILDRQLGVDGVVNGVRSPSVLRTWPANAIELVGDADWAKFNLDTFKSVMPKYEDPFPLNDKYFLCSRMTGVGESMGIYLLDVFGNEILVHAEEGTGPNWGCYDPMPIRTQERPLVIPTRRDFENKEGDFYIADVYQGTHMAGVARGSVKTLRVVASPEKRFWSNAAWEGQGQEAPAMNWVDFANKQILGTVPVAEDGSAYFAVPSDTFVYFQLLDEKGMMIQSMRSGTIVQSGERQGCVGCHEPRTSAAPVAPGGSMMAVRQQPHTLEGWYGPARDFNYLREVQPVFNKYCVQCHDYGKKAGEILNLAGDRDLVFNTSYNELWRKKYIASIGAGPAQIQQASSWGSRASKLIEVISKPHHDVAMDKESLDRIITWIDINAPYYPKYSTLYPDNLAGRSPLDSKQIERLTALTGVKLAETMGCNKSLGPQISFDRPTLSPCLKTLSADPGSIPFKEAVALIEAGRVQLPDDDSVEKCAVDAQREGKYVARARVEREIRAAIREGRKIQDAE